MSRIVVCVPEPPPGHPLIYMGDARRFTESQHRLWVLDASYMLPGAVAYKAEETHNTSMEQRRPASCWVVASGFWIEAATCEIMHRSWRWCGAWRGQCSVLVVTGVCPCVPTAQGADFQSISNARTKIPRPKNVIGHHCSTFNAQGPTLL